MPEKTVRTQFSLFWSLSPNAQVLLMEYQYNEYGHRVTVPAEPGGVHIAYTIEPLPVIEKIMKKKPRHAKRVV